MRKLFSLTLLALLLAEILALAFSIHSVRAGGTIYIRADGSVDPPTAPIQRDGSIYTFTDNINDSLVVEKSNIIIDGADYTLQGIEAYGTGIAISGRTNVTIQNININGFYYGICIELSSSIRIIKNSITNNNYGIRSLSSSNNMIGGNKIANNTGGIYFGSSSYNNIDGNIIANNSAGIFLFYYSSYNCINGNDIVSNHYGIYLQLSSDNYINGNNIVSNYYGIYDEESSSNSISENYITANDYCGVYVLYSSYNNIISRNIVRNSEVGVEIYDYSSCNSVNENQIANNTIGILLMYSSSNSISGNYITGNFIGTALSHDSSNNIFWHNFFVGNTVQVDSSFDLVNIWDNDYPSGGNYWSDYRGVDFYSGPYQNETGSDFIGDTPYVINENNQDNYPLMNLTTAAIAITNITFSNLHPAVDEIIQIYVTLENQGSSVETFDLSLKCARLFNSLIGTQTITLASSESATLNFTWIPSTTGRYEIRASTSPIPEDIYQEDNIFIAHLYVRRIGGGGEISQSFQVLLY